MPVRNGLLSTLRAKGRTALFVLLILVLTIALALGLGMWAYSGGLLAQMEEQFTSVAVVEYMGENYPNENEADEEARAALEALDGAAMSAVNGVELWERNQSTLVSIDGYKRPAGDSPYRSYGIVVGNMTPEYVEVRAEVDKSELTESRVVLKHMSDGDVYEFVLSGLEPLELPYYNYDETSGVCYREGTGEEVDKESVTSGVILRHGRNAYGSWWGYQWLGELPEGYKPDVMYDLMETASYDYYPYQQTTDDGAYDMDEGMYVGNNVLALSDCYGRVSSILYTTEGKESFLCYFRQGTTDFIPVEGQKYLLHGQFVSGYRGGRTFEVTPFPDSEDDPWVALSGNDDPALTEGIFVEHAERYRLANNTATLTSSDSISALEAFQQGTLYLAEGRFPQAGEQGVCVISGSIAESMRLSVGDRLELEILSSSPEVRADVFAAGDKRALEIVGVTNPQSDYADRLWVSAGVGSFSAPLFGYSLGMAVLNNRKAVQAAEALSALLPSGVRLTLYDQGYAAAARPIQAMETAAEAITLAASCGALAVLVLFAFLFVGRQKETVGVLASLGTPVGKIRMWLLSGAAAVSGTAALAGAVIGVLTLGRVTEAAMETAARLYATDTRYSEAALGIAKRAEVTGTIPVWPAPLAGAAVFAVAVALCLVFLRHARKENVPKKGKMSVRVPSGHTSTTGRGALRFAALSARRGGRRSVVALATALVLTLFVSLLAASAQGWSEQVDRLYADSKLDGRVVSLNGRMQTGLVVPIRSVQALWKSGYLDDISVGMSWNYWVSGTAPGFSSGGFGEETRKNWIKQQPTLSAVNSLSAAGEFFYVDNPEVQWLEGWDESFLADADYPSLIDAVFGDGSQEQTTTIWPVLASSRFLEQQGLELGDTVNVDLPLEFYLEQGLSSVQKTVTIRVVGFFAAMGTKDNLYGPLALWCGPEWVYGEGDGELSDRVLVGSGGMDNLKRWLYAQTNFGVCRFTLRSAYELEDLRGWLADQRYSQVGVTNRNRTTVLLRDQNFVETVDGLGRYISFSEILFPVLFLVVGLMGFIISWLMVSSRRMEFAIMRGLGASPRRTFASFFLEQAALCLLGCLVGAAAMTVRYPGGAGAVWLAGGGFLICYLVGCALSVLAAGRTNLLLLLSERE